ncbi:hypothetical protein [Streptomyces sp. NPDC002276]
MMIFRKMCRKGVIGFRVLLILVIAFCTATLALSSWKIWHLTGRQEAVAIWVLFGAAVLDPMIRLVKEYRRPTDEKLSEPLQGHLSPFLSDVVDLTQADWRLVGVQAFRVRSFGHWKCLHRCKRLRVYAHPGPVDVRWTKNKGALGKCWADDAWTVHSMRVAAQQFGVGVKPTRAQFDGLSEDDRMGLGYEEYGKLIKEFSEYAAYPIRDAEGNFIGCLVIDIPNDADPQHQPPNGESLLDVAGLKQKAAFYADTAGRIMSKA